MTTKEKRRFLDKATDPQLRKKRKQKRLTVKDKEQIWALMRIHRNKSLVAEMMGVHRRTIHRFLEHYPIPETFKLLEDVEDFEEIKTWKRRQLAFSKQSVMRQYLTHIRKMYEWIQQHYPDRARPRLWTSDHILEFVATYDPTQQHNPLVALRSLALKCPKLFALIDIGLLPTRRTHAQKVSLAGKDQWYFDIEPEQDINQVKDMIENVPDQEDPELHARNQCIIATLFNTACRTGDPSTGLGLCGILIENLDLDDHKMEMKEKHDITWIILGLSDETIAYMHRYLEVRGNPTQGFLFVDKKGHPIHGTEVNRIIKEAGRKAGIKKYNPKTGEGKKLLAKAFRKTLVKYALETLEMNPMSLIGTGKKRKTCFCVGWTDMKILVEHYAPRMEKTINEDRAKFRIGHAPEETELPKDMPIPTPTVR